MITERKVELPKIKRAEPLMTLPLNG